MDLKMLIGGEAVDALDGATIENINPATGERIGTVPAAAKQDVDRAVELAVEGHREWKRVPLYRRIEIFDRYRELIAENREKLARIMCFEGGKRIEDARGEIDILAYIFRVFGEGARNHYGLTLTNGIEPRVEKDLVLTKHEPLGVVACIVPFNYPAELYAHKVAPALITGNSVLIKPSSDTPMSAILFTELLHQAGVPANAAQVVTGSGEKIGDWISANPKVAAISLTGSTAVGTHIMQAAASHVPHLFLELGGNDPLIVFPDADLDQAVSEALAGRISNAGQTCCATKRLLVHNTVKETFTEKLITALKDVKVGNPIEEGVEMGPLINQRNAQKVMDQIKETVTKGGKCLLGGSAKGTFVEPTVLTDITADMEIARDMEVFGPVFPIIGFDTAREAVEIANSSVYGLHGGIMTADMKLAMRVAEELECGCVVLGGTGNYRSAHQAFGGYKSTGIGREGISYTLNEFTQTKTIAWKQLYE